jgi:plasmid stabilization system protein ParE
MRDMDELEEFLKSVMSQIGANKYIDTMIAEVMSLSVFADLYRTSTKEDILQYHPQARRMVSHNKRWVYIFHIEDETVIVDRIRPAKLITK